VKPISLGPDKPDKPDRQEKPDKLNKPNERFMNASYELNDIYGLNNPNVGAHFQLPMAIRFQSKGLIFYRNQTNLSREM
jgi:hypothetical protein